MKAIIIQDSDACNLLDLLKLETFGEPEQWSNSEAWHALPKHVRDEMAV